MVSLSDTTVQVSTVPVAQPARQAHRQLTPSEVLERLPADATPAQQDSAIRAHITPEPITHWSECPDTLHLPGHSPGEPEHDHSLQYYYLNETYFAQDSMFHPELCGVPHGVSGDPVPYSIAGDSWISSVLILCFLMASIAISRSRHLITQQVKRFFPTGSSEKLSLNETTEEFRHQLFFVLCTCLMLGLVYFMNHHGGHRTAYILPEYLIVATFVGMVAVYFALKFGLFAMTGAVFFDRRSNEQWLKSYLFLVSLEGVLLFPIVLLVAYFSMPSHIAVICMAAVLVFVKILSIYKCKTIFFKSSGVYLQIFLYFCALEVIPLLALLGSLGMVSQYLRINI